MFNFCVREDFQEEHTITRETTRSKEPIKGFHYVVRLGFSRIQTRWSAMGNNSKNRI